MPQAQSNRIDLEQFVREVLDGVVGDDPQPATMDEAITAVERALVAKARRPLNESERTRVQIETAWQWNQRQAAQPEVLSLPVVSTPTIPSPVPPAGPFHTSDGRYFASDADRRAHQRTLDEKAARHEARVRARTGGEQGAA